MPTLIVETGSGDSAANTYLSEADATAYFLDKGNAEWAAAIATKKQESLIVGTQFIDSQYGRRWLGTRSVSTQRLSWPRANVIDYDGLIISPTSIPRKLKEATAEAALKSLVGEIVENNVGGIKREMNKVGEIETETEYVGGKSASPSFTLILNLLADFIGLHSLERS